MINNELIEKMRAIYKGEKGGSEMEVIFLGNGNMANIVPTNAQIEHVMLKGANALYFQRTDNGSNERKAGKWVDPIAGTNSNLILTLSTQSKEISKSHLLELAE